MVVRRTCSAQDPRRAEQPAPARGRSRASCPAVSARRLRWTAEALLRRDQWASDVSRDLLGRQAEPSRRGSAGRLRPRCLRWPGA